MRLEFFDKLDFLFFKLDNTFTHRLCPLHDLIDLRCLALKRLLLSLQFAKLLQTLLILELELDHVLLKGLGLLLGELELLFQAVHFISLNVFFAVVQGFLGFYLFLERLFLSFFTL